MTREVHLILLYTQDLSFANKMNTVLPKYSYVLTFTISVAVDDSDHVPNKSLRLCRPDLGPVSLKAR